jgi:glycosyltransferase involved in cell wall biosynthesis
VNRIDAASNGTAPGTDPRPLVLHVVEALGGGVMAAVGDYVSSASPEFRHALLARVRPGHDTGDLWGVPLIPFRSDRPGPGMIAQVNQVVRRLRPQVVHAHSSWAGLVVRLANVPRDRIAYTPHCYAFERTDRGRGVRGAFGLAEWLLAGRTGLVVAVSPREAQLAHRLGAGRRVRYVPNVVPVLDEVRPAPVPGERRPVVVAGVGRLMAQKDPAWFADVVRAARRRGAEIDAVWLGGGEPAAEAALERAGVRVSGWIPRAELLARLAGADVYVHSAAWEGAPLALLEAVALGVPVIARDIPALRSMSVPDLHATADSAAERLARMAVAPPVPAGSAGGGSLVAHHTRRVQRSRLVESYLTMAGTPEIPSPRRPVDP